MFHKVLCVIYLSPIIHAIEIGSCINAGYDTCCTDGLCAGVPEEANCFCDSICLLFNDCCADFDDICPGTYELCW